MISMTTYMFCSLRYDYMELLGFFLILGFLHLDLTTQQIARLGANPAIRLSVKEWVQE